MSHQPPPGRDRETIVTDRGGSSSGPVVAAVIGVLAVLFFVWLFMFSGVMGDGNVDDGGTRDVDVDVNIDRDDTDTDTDTDTDADTDGDDG